MKIPPTIARGPGWLHVDKITKAPGYPHHFGNTKRITSGNIQKSHTPHTLDGHFGQHGKHHFEQHGKHHSSYLIT